LHHAEADAHGESLRIGPGQAGVKSMEPQHGSDSGNRGSGTERIAAFSDGVVAIIITIMVLDLKLPEAAAEGEVWPGFLAPLAPKLAIYALSFVIVGGLWINHHQLLSVVRRATPRLMWMNLLLLFSMSLIPLATGFLGEHPQLARAISFYALIMALNAAVFGLLRYRLGRMPDHDRGHIQFRRATLVRSFASTLLYALAAIAAPFSPVAALVLLIFVPAMFNIPMLFQRGRRS
jgi:TMEM175 potassium channel family protein